MYSLLASQFKVPQCQYLQKRCDKSTHDGHCTEAHTQADPVSKPLVPLSFEVNHFCFSLPGLP